MKSFEYLIIGGSAAGTTAAEVIRGLKPDSSIAIVSDEDHEQYSRVLIPHYIRKKVEREQVFLKKPEWYAEKKIELLAGVKAESMDSDGHKIKVSGGEEIGYSKLLISVGGEVVRLAVLGSDAQNILYMRTVEDADRIKEVASKSKTGVVIGGGFIGLEFSSCFKVNGVENITILVREPYFWSTKLDLDSSKVLVSVLERNGISVLCGEEVESFEKGEDGSVSKVVTKSGKVLDCDVVGVGVGIKSNFSWLEGSGISIKKGIVTSEYLETNLEDVYAAGDCSEFYDVIFDRQHMLGNWANATSQGSAVGKNMAGEKTVFETASSYSITFFDGGSCSFIGVTDSDFADEIITRGSVESGKMTRIFIKTIGGVMRAVGATVINNPVEVAPLTLAIKNKTDVSKSRERLQDTNFDLKELII